VTITHAPDARSTAILLLGWFAAQLGWSAHGFGGSRLTFTADGNSIVCELAETAGSSISRVLLESDGIHVSAEHLPLADHLNLEINWKDGRSAMHLLPADSGDLADILDEELANGGQHRVYLKALTAAAALL
jgi:hypothetical protein